jgi:hypothetical protein
MIRSEAAVEQEIERIRALQADCYNDILYGAIAALRWACGVGAAPSEVETVLRESKVNRRPPEKTGMIG